MWTGKRREREKNVLIGMESVLVCHLFIFCVVVRNDTDGRKTVGRGHVAVGVKQW